MGMVRKYYQCAEVACRLPAAGLIFRHRDHHRSGLGCLFAKGKVHTVKTLATAFWGLIFALSGSVIFQLTSSWSAAGVEPIVPTVQIHRRTGASLPATGSI